MRKWAQNLHTIPKHYLFVECCVSTARNYNKRLTKNLASSHDLTLALQINLCIPVAISRAKIPNFIT